MKHQTPDIVLIYGTNSFSDEEVNELQMELSKQNLELLAKEQSPYINASLDIFVPYIQILLSPDIIASLCQGVLASAVYDVIKSFCMYIYRKFRKHHILKVEAGPKITKQLANIHLTVGNSSLVLPLEIDDEKFQYVLDRFLELAAHTESDERILVFFSNDQDALVQKTEQEIIDEEYRKKVNKTS